MPPILEAILWALLAAVIVGLVFGVTVGYGGVAAIITFLIVLLYTIPRSRRAGV